MRNLLSLILCLFTLITLQAQATTKCKNLDNAVEEIASIEGIELKDIKFKDQFVFSENPMNQQYFIFSARQLGISGEFDVRHAHYSCGPLSGKLQFRSSSGASYPDLTKSFEVDHCDWWGDATYAALSAEFALHELRSREPALSHLTMEDMRNTFNIWGGKRYVSHMSGIDHFYDAANDKAVYYGIYFQCQKATGKFSYLGHFKTDL